MVLIAVFVCFARAQDPRSERARLGSILNFEQGALPNGDPVGWGGNVSNGKVLALDATVAADDKRVHGGRWSVRVQRDEKSPGGHSGITKVLPIDFSGKSIELRGFIRTENVKDYVGLLLWEAGDSPRLEFDNMQSRRVNGTRDWTEYSVKLPLRPAAKQLFFGFLVVGPGTAWVDDLQLLVDSKPIGDAPERPKPPPGDHEFDLGSKISLTPLTPLQIENLVTLGKVWGFLKYYHPAVTNGSRQWDYDLFRVLPSILAARDRASANSEILKWTNGLGAVTECKSCTELKTGGLQMRPDLDWISRESLIGKELSTVLTGIHRNRIDDQQFYVAALFPGVGNPIFQELGHKDVRFPDAGYQLLALYRFWNIIEYWFPYRDVMGEDWGRVLAEFVPRLALARDFDSYQRELMAVISRVHDTHAVLSSGPRWRGNCQVPIRVRFVENQFVVWSSRDGELHAGDILLELDDRPFAHLVEEWKPYTNGSNDAALKRNTSESILRGACGDTSLRVQRGTARLDLKTRRVPVEPGDLRRRNDLPGETFRLLSPEVAYLKISTAKMADAPRYIESAAGTKGLIIDLRAGPVGLEFLVFALGRFLVDRDTPFATLTFGDLSNPGAFYWSKTPERIAARQPRYLGRIVILVDEVTQSTSEYHAMAFRAVPNAIVIGSTTAGADGNVSRFTLPGGLTAQISGVGVFYPDHRPTQRVGIVPDITIRPTVAGIRDQRDEVLEAALRQILGPDVPETRIRELAKP